MKRFYWLVLALVVLLTSATPAQAATCTYGDFTRMLTRSAGQYWSGNQAYQWAWSPISPTESWISWGDPKTWPPSYGEHFIVSGDWVLIDGWADNGTYYKITTTVDWTATGTSCTGTRVDFPTGGAQHYAHWTIPTTGYCMFTEGTITEQSSSKQIHYRHEQIWSPPAPCPTNPYLPAATCIKQTERWSDDNGLPFAPRLLRDVWIARGYGMAWQIRNYAPTANPTNPGPVTWRADGRYYWSW